MRNPFRTRLSVLVLTVFTALGLLASSACGGTSPTGTAAPSSAPSGAPSSAPAAAGRTVTDMAGRQVTVPATVNSIGTFGAIGVLNAFVELFGEGDKIANNMSASFTSSDRWKYQYKFAPQIANKPVFEKADRSVDIEVVLANKPDLAVTMTKETANLLESRGVTVVYLEWKNVDDVKKAVTLMGDVLGKPEVAKNYIAYFDRVVGDTKTATDKLPAGQKKKVLYGSPSTLTNPHVISEWWIAAAGGESVSAKAHTGESLKYTMEDLLAWNPDVILVSAKSEVEALNSDARYASITAVKNKAIYVVPTVAHTWGNRTVEQPLTIRWTMNKLYPDLQSDEQLSREIKDFYSTYYKYDMTDAEVAEIVGPR